MLTTVKRYLNIQTSEYDDFLEKLINSIVEEFSIFNIPILSTKESFYFVKDFETLFFRRIPVVELKVFLTSNENEIPATGYNFNDTGFYYMLSFKEKSGRDLKVKIVRGFTTLPSWLEIEIAKLVAIDFKESYQGEGILTNESDVLGELQRNYKNLIEARKAIWENIFNIIGGRWLL